MTCASNRDVQYGAEIVNTRMFLLLFGKRAKMNFTQTHVLIWGFRGTVAYCMRCVPFKLLVHLFICLNTKMSDI